MIEHFLKDLSASDKFWLATVACITLVAVTRIVLVDFLMVLIRGYDDGPGFKIVEHRSACKDESNLTGLCLRNPKSRCDTAHDCEAAMQGDL